SSLREPRAERLLAQLRGFRRFLGGGLGGGEFLFQQGFYAPFAGSAARAAEEGGFERIYRGVSCADRGFDVAPAPRHEDADQIVVRHPLYIGYKRRGVKIIFWIVGGGFLAGWVLWHASLTRVWRWLGARPISHFPGWNQVRERLELLARRERLPLPQLW